MSDSVSDTRPGEQCPDGIERVGLVRTLVVAVLLDPGESQRDAAGIAGRRLRAVDGDLDPDLYVVAGGAFEVQPTYTWQSKVFFSDDNDIPALQVSNFVPDTAQDEFQDAYGLLNLRVRYQPTSGDWTVEAFGENLLDEEYVKDAGNTGDALGMPTFIAGRPLTWGLSVRLRY